MEEKYMKSKKIIMITMCCLICVMAIGYAAFATNLTINGTANITSAWKVLFTKIEEVSKTSGVTITKVPTAEGTNATFNVDLKSPGDKIIYKITVANQGTLDAIINDITASETGSDAIKFEITGIKKGDKLAKATTTTFNVTISYDESVTMQPVITDNTLTIGINYVQDMSQTVTPENPTIKTTRLAAAILKDNTALTDTNIDFSQISSDTNGKGLYYTNKNTEEGKTTYYFRGAVENNYVSFRKMGACIYKDADVAIFNEDGDVMETFEVTKEQCQSTNVCETYYNNELVGAAIGITKENCLTWNNDENFVNDGYEAVWTNEKAKYEDEATDELWRIVRINEDGSIRLIKQYKIGYSAFNEIDDADYDNSYVGYMYGNVGSSTYEETHKNTNSSAIKIVLDAWYQSNLAGYSSIIADSGFCGDRSLSSGTGIGNDITQYGAHGRLSTNKTPQFKCPQSNDLYTTPTSAKGNKALTYPIGLITADEVVYAGGVMGTNNADCYMSGDSWTMSPLGRHKFGIDVVGITNIFYVGGFYVGHIDGGVRPVINLKATVEITGGDGTESNPYIIKTN